MIAGEIVILDSLESFLKFFDENPELKWRFLGGLNEGDILCGSFFGGMDTRIINEEIWKKEVPNNHIVILEQQKGEKDPIIFSIMNIKTFYQYNIKLIRNDRAYTNVSTWIGGPKITPRELIAIGKKYKPILEKYNII